MLKKRLIGVVTVKDGWAVQSMGYRRHLPLGKPECLVENLDRWGADEILVQVIDRSVSRAGPDFTLLERLARLGIGTPLIYCGGIASVTDGVNVVQTGADRIALDVMLHDQPAVVRGLAEHLGAQALIAALPVACGAQDLEWLDYRTDASAPLSAAVIELLDHGVVSEALVIDWRNEGSPGSFDLRLIERFPCRRVPLIAFGGISSAGQMGTLLAHTRIAAVAVGNFLSYREHAVQQFKNELASAALRPSRYASSFD